MNIVGYLKQCARVVCSKTAGDKNDSDKLLMLFNIERPRICSADRLGQSSAFPTLSTSFLVNVF